MRISRSLYKATLILAGGVLYVVMAKTADAQTPHYEELVRPERFWASDQDYYTHDTCLSSSTAGIIERVFEDAQEFSIGLTHKGTYPSFSRDASNTIGCAWNSPFDSALLEPEAGVDFVDQELLIRHLGGSHYFRNNPQLVHCKQR